MAVFLRRSPMPVSAEALFAWHARPGALERLLPPWQPVSVLERSGDGIRDGARVVLAMGPRPVALRWEALHDGFVEGREFRDVQVAGPFATWTHRHRMEPDGPDRSVLEDHVTWAMPLGAERLVGRFVETQLDRMFAFRHARTRADLARHAAAGPRPLRVALTGASGLIGRALTAFLRTGGHTVLPLVRGHVREPGAIAWDPARGTIDAPALEGVDAMVHLAGEPVSARWTPERRAAIRASRVAGTRLVAETLARLAQPPRVLVSASAIGWYGTGDDAPRDETAAPGDDFLADVCREWEAAADAARAAGIRVVHPRLGVVLSAAGGALGTMLPPFRAGVGGVVGSGRQVMSWVGLDDVLYALHHLLRDDGVAGPVNLVAPHAVTNAEFTATLARVLRRPAVLPLPAPVVRGLFGAMGESLLLSGARIVPGVLAACGFAFEHASLEALLRFELGR